MLKEYINQITNKDKLFEKMASTIEQLKSRLKAMEQFKKEKEKIEKESNINYYLSNMITFIIFINVVLRVIPHFLNICT